MVVVGYGGDKLTILTMGSVLSIFLGTIETAVFIVQNQSNISTFIWFNILLGLFGSIEAKDLNVGRDNYNC